MTKVICISDSHDKHDEIYVPSADILIHAGDATMTGTRQQLTDFVIWLSIQPTKYKVWIAGNHDFGMETDQAAYAMWAGRRGRNKLMDVNQTRSEIIALCNSLGVTYLHNSGINIEGLNIWGSPDTPAFYGWAFNRTQRELQEHWKTVPDNTDILVSHGPAYGVLDALEDGTMVGDIELMKRINTLPKLKLHVCGHIHPSYGSIEVDGSTRVNASILDDSYKVRNKAIEVIL